MIYRAFKRKRDGAWLSALLTTSKPAFTATAAEHRTQVAKSYGLGPDDLDAVDAPTDPRVAPLVMPRLPDDATAALAETLANDVLAEAGPLPPQVQDKVRQRIKDRLAGRL